MYSALAFPPFSSLKRPVLWDWRLKLSFRTFMSPLLRFSNQGSSISTNKPCCDNLKVRAARLGIHVPIRISSTCVSDTRNFALRGRSLSTRVHASASPGTPELPNIDAHSTKNQDGGPTYSLQDTKVGACIYLSRYG